MVGNEQVRIKETSPIGQIELSGQFIGGDETADLRVAILGLVEKSKDVVIDMSNVSYVNSSFLGTLLAGQTAISRLGGRLAIAGLNDGLKKIFTTTQLDRLVQMHETADEAASAFLSADKNS